MKILVFLFSLLFSSLASAVVTAALKWDAVQDATSYIIYIGTATGNYTYTQNANSTEAFVPNLNENTKYFFAVAAVNVEGESTKSNEVAFSIPTFVATTAGFAKSATSGGTSTVFTFTDTSTGSNYLWTWDFGDGSPVVYKRKAGDFVTKTFSEAGSYTVTLTVKNRDGTTDNETQLITIS